MSDRARLAVFLVAAAGLAAALGVGLGGLPPFGARVTAYGRLLLRVATSQRHVTDVVAAVTFDYRGIDTLFEEYILLAAVTGVGVLLRPLGDEMRSLPDDEAPDRSIPPPSPAVGLLGVILCPVLVVMALETVSHGQVSPGGGFQAGVIGASAAFVAYLATDYQTVDRFQTSRLIEAAEAIGAGGYVVVGLVGLAVAGVFLANVIGLGSPGSVWSGGTILLLNLLVGVEVSAGFIVLVTEFLDQTAVIRSSER